MTQAADVRMPGESRFRPLHALGWRILVGVVLTVITTAGTWFGRGGYTDGAGGGITLLDSLYYATVAITTTGYGDIYPASDSARLFTTLFVTPAKIVFLVLLVGTSVELIARASSNLILEARWRRGVKQHTVICGFGVKGRAALNSLLDQGADASNVVVIDPDAHVADEAGRLGCVAVVGDSTRNEDLLAAAVDRAAVVIVAPSRDDAAVLTVLSVRALNSSVRIVAAARELENAPLLRHSGADVVLTSSGSVGRMMGLAARTPHHVRVVEELIEQGHGLDLRERSAVAGAPERLRDQRLDGELVIAVFRDDELIERVPDGNFVVQPGDQLVSVVRR